VGSSIIEHVSVRIQRCGFGGLNHREQIVDRWAFEQICALKQASLCDLLHELVSVDDLVGGEDLGGSLALVGACETRCGLTTRVDLEIHLFN
jgi:hypothetical protein